MRSPVVLLLLPLLLLLLLDLASAQMEIVGSAPRDGTIVKEGRSVRLSCRASTRYNFFQLYKGKRVSKILLIIV